MKRKIIFWLSVFSLFGYQQEVIAQTSTIKANGIDIAYESFGPSGRESILLIAGTNRQLTMWPKAFCQELVKRGYRVIRFDNRDIGLSTKLDEAGMPDWASISQALKEKRTPVLPYSLDDMADDAVGLLRALGIEKAHIVGASMGGMIAQRIAYNHPESTLSLASIMAGGGNATFPLVAKPEVVAQIPPPGNLSDTAAYIEKELQSALILSGNTYKPNEPALLELVKADVERSYYPHGLMRQGAASLAGFYAGRHEHLKTIKVNTVIIHGDEDPLVALEAGKDVAANIPGAEFKLIKGMGHSISEPLFDLLADIIVRNAMK